MAKGWADVRSSLSKELLLDTAAPSRRDLPNKITKQAKKTNEKKPKKMTVVVGSNLEIRFQSTDPKFSGRDWKNVWERDTLLMLAKFFDLSP